MQQYRAEAVINQDGMIILSLPFPVGKRVDVLVMSSDDSLENEEWRKMALKNFLDGYPDEDSVYDDL